MGTTVVGAMFSPRKKRMYIGHVGDSRCYRVRKGAIQLMTRDHSLINDYLLAMPDLSEEQRSELPKNVITRALGMQDQVVVDLQHDTPEDGDVYVLCSDGLSGMIVDDEIQRIITSANNIGEACRKLIEKANEHGGEDNITAVLIKIEELQDTVEDGSPPSLVSGDAPTVIQTKAAILSQASSQASDESNNPPPENFGEEPTHPGAPDARTNANAQNKPKP
jgi:PPM family protein phosphatase